MLLMPAFGATAKGLRLYEGQMVGDIQLMLMMQTLFFLAGKRSKGCGDIQLMLMMRTFLFLAGKRSPS